MNRHSLAQISSRHYLARGSQRLFTFVTQKCLRKQNYYSSFWWFRSFSSCNTFFHTSTSSCCHKSSGKSWHIVFNVFPFLFFFFITFPFHIIICIHSLLVSFSPCFCGGTYLLGLPFIHDLICSGRRVILNFCHTYSGRISLRNLKG